MSSTKNYNLDIDTTLGGSGASDYIIPSQKAIKSYADNLVTYLANKSVETIQNITQLSSGSITLTATSSIYKITPSAATTFTLSLASGTTESNQAYTFELHINMTTVYTMDFSTNNTVVWEGGVTPDLTTTGYYRLAFQTTDGGTTWHGNLQGKW